MLRPRAEDRRGSPDVKSRPAVLRIEEKFSPYAEAMRRFFEEVYADPRSSRGERFVWDFWHVPDQYTLLRTPAWEYFSNYKVFHKHLVLWARENLGCWDISPPWLSLYIDGCRQLLHSDVPHGPLAWVLSLSPPGRLPFQGGETEILRPETLDYWQGFDARTDRELSSFVSRTAPKFNRLVIFDPRLPHGVTPLRGSPDPREGRLVIHGWFTEPKPFVSGPLDIDAFDEALSDALPRILSSLGPDLVLHGLLSLRLEIAATGKVDSIKVLASTLIPLGPCVIDRERLARTAERQIIKGLAKLGFPATDRPSRVTLPLIFR